MLWALVISSVVLAILLFGLTWSYLFSVTDINQGTFVFTEGDLVDLNIDYSDMDNDNITITYSSPLNSEGRWQTTKGDAGIYKVKITASDDINEDSETIRLVVNSKK